MAKKQIKGPVKSTVKSTKKVDIEKDLGIYKIDPKRDVDILQDVRIVYTMLGSQDGLHNGDPVVLCDDFDDRALAKKEVKNGKETLSIKVNGQGRLMNPMLADLDNSVKAKIMKENKINQFKVVNAECFAQYLMFLKTKNVVHYKFAERVRQ